MIPQRRQNGFTIIELTLAMAFISILLLSVVFISIQVGQMYNRGMVLRSINHAGQDIDSMMRRDFLQSDQRQIKGPDNNIVISIRDGGEVISNRFCLGRYTYIWNAPRVIDEGINSSAVVKGSDGKPINFVRVLDENSSLCQQTSTGGYIMQLNEPEKVTQLLKSQSGNEVVLTVYSLSITPVALMDGSPEGLYRVQYTIGTGKVGEINTSDQTCKPPTDDSSNIEFCSINQFDAIVRTNG